MVKQDLTNVVKTIQLQQDVTIDDLSEDIIGLREGCHDLHLRLSVAEARLEERARQTLSQPQIAEKPKRGRPKKEDPNFLD